MSQVTKDALIKCRKRRDPKAFAETVTCNLTANEKNSEVIKFTGWAIFSTLERFQKDGAANENGRKLLNTMFIRLDKVDDYYFDNFYSTDVSLLNSGGLTLPSVNFYPFGMELMEEIRINITIDTINRNPQSGLRLAADKLIKNSQLEDRFNEICKQCWGMDGKKCGIAEKHLNSTINAVYKIMLPKVIHAFSGPLVRRWQELKISKEDKVGFRPGLKAGVAAKSRKAKNDRRAETEKKSGSGNGKTPMKVTPEERDLFAETSTGQRSKKRKKDKSKTVGRDGEELTMDTVNLM